MNTNFQMLKSLLSEYNPETRGFSTPGEVKLIRDKLCIMKMDVLQLRNLRDFTVIYLSHLSKSFEDEMKNMDRISAITNVIDCRILDLGGEV